MTEKVTKWIAELKLDEYLDQMLSSGYTNIESIMGLNGLSLVSEGDRTLLGAAVR